jgi:hypothetical protein
VSTPHLLTVAYMAMGAQKVLDKNPELVGRYDGGELELISAVIGYAQAADDLASEKTFELQGVFVYEVAEPLGDIVGRMLVRERDMDGAVKRHTAFLVAECCGQSLDDEQVQER